MASRLRAQTAAPARITWPTSHGEPTSTSRAGNPIMRRTLPWLVVALLALAGAPSSAVGAPAKVVTIGVIAPLDAGLTSFGHGIRDSVELAVKQANDAKVVPGWTIKVRALDDSSDPAKGARAAKKLATDPDGGRGRGPVQLRRCGAGTATARAGGHRARLAVEHAHLAHPRRRSRRPSAPIRVVLPYGGERLAAGRVPCRTAP